MANSLAIDKEIEEYGLSVRNNVKKTISMRQFAVGTGFFSMCPLPGTLLCLWLMLNCAPSVMAQNFEAKVASSEVIEGSIFEVEFSLDSDEGRRFISPSFGTFKVVSGPNMVNAASFINGKSSVRTSWHFELEATRIGTYNIGAATVTVNGKTLKSNPLEIKVVAARQGKGLPKNANEGVFLISEFDKKTVFPGQQITWRIKVYTQVSLEGADIVELPDFAGFYSREKRRFDGRVTYQTINKKKYAVKTLHEEALFPQQSGSLRLGPAKVRLLVEQGGAMGAFLGPKAMLMSTEPVGLEVKPLPEPVPENFSGAVGRYEWSVSVDSSQVTTDDAITVTIQLKGNGDGKRVAAPGLNLPKSMEVFAPRVASEEEYETVELVQHRKIFEYVILPHEPGAYSLTPLFLFFDPDSLRYCALPVPALDSLRIQAGKNYQTNAAADTTVQTIPFEDQTQASGWTEKITNWSRNPLFWAAFLLPFAAAGFFFFYRNQRSTAPVLAGKRALTSEVLPRHEPPSIIADPTPKPAPEVQKIMMPAHLRHLITTGQTRAFYDEAFKILKSALAAKTGIPAAQLTADLAIKLLNQRQASPIYIQHVLFVWQTCEQALFAGQPLSAHMEDTLSRLSEVV